MWPWAIQRAPEGSVVIADARPPSRSPAAALTAWAVALLLACPARADQAPAPAASPLPASAPSADAERIRRLEQRVEQLELRSLNAERRLALEIEEEKEKQRALEREKERQKEKEKAADAKKVVLAAAWRDSFNLEAEGFRLRIGSLVQADGRYFAGNENPSILSQFAIRSARIDLEGSLWKWVDFRFMSDFAAARFTIEDAYTEIHLFPQLRIRGGKMKVPFGLERLQPEGRFAFMERAYPTRISPNRDIGLMLFGEVGEGTLQYQAGVYNGVVDDSTLDVAAGDDKEIVARAFFHPLRKTSLSPLRDLGVGGAFAYRANRGTVTTPSLLAIRSDGRNDFFTFVTGATADDTALADGTHIVATAQAYYYFWRIGAMAEYVWNSQQVRRAALRSPVAMQAWQGYVTFLLTPDQASYCGVRPERPFDLTPGHRAAGAFELGFRYSGITIDEGAFANGFADPAQSPRTAHSYTVGFNWYLNANAKVQLNYVRTDFIGGAPMGANRPPENALMARMQFQF